jgi:hypothetical protein
MRHLLMGNVVMLFAAEQCAHHQNFWFFGECH